MDIITKQLEMNIEILNINFKFKYLSLLSNLETTVAKKNSLRKSVFKTRPRRSGKHRALKRRDMSQEGSKVLF